VHLPAAYASKTVQWIYALRSFKEIGRRLGSFETVRRALKTVRRYTAINQFAPKSREAHIVAKKALAQITALKQKD
jgi:hypothetical protein